jgi:hypothetical protein
MHWLHDRVEGPDKRDRPTKQWTKLLFYNSEPCMEKIDMKSPQISDLAIK